MVITISRNYVPERSFLCDVKVEDFLCPVKIFDFLCDYHGYDYDDYDDDNDVCDGDHD